MFDSVEVDCLLVDGGISIINLLEGVDKILFEFSDPVVILRLECFDLRGIGEFEVLAETVDLISLGRTEVLETLHLSSFFLGGFGSDLVLELVDGGLVTTSNT